MLNKKIKLEKRERQCKSRKNIQKICVSKKDNKSLRKRDVAKIIKLQKRATQCQSRKNIQKKCEGKNNMLFTKYCLSQKKKRE